MSKRLNLSAKQRREAVLALLRREEPAAMAAGRYGICETTLHRRRDEFIQAGEAALANGKKGNDAQTRRYLTRTQCCSIVRCSREPLLLGSQRVTRTTPH